MSAGSEFMVSTLSRSLCHSVELVLKTPKGPYQKKRYRATQNPYPDLFREKLRMTNVLLVKDITGDNPGKL